MSLEAVARRVRTVADGTATEFEFGFKIFEETDIKVYTIVRTTNVATLKAINSDYEVEIDANGGGTVTFDPAPSATLDILILGDLEKIQPTEIDGFSAFPHESIEKSLDRAIIIGHENLERINGCLKLPIGIDPDDFDLTFPEDLSEGAGKIPVFNEDGTGWAPVADWVTADEVEAAQGYAEAAAASQTAAAASQSAAASSAAVAATSETNAQSSAAAALTSENNAAAYAVAALSSEQAAETAEINAQASEDAAADYASDAATSESNAAASESAAATSESNAAASESAAEAALAATEAARDLALAAAGFAKVTKTHTDFQTAGLTQTIEAFVLPAKNFLMAVFVKHSQAFAGGAISDYKVSLGVAGDEGKFIEVFDVDQAPGDEVFEPGLPNYFKSFGSSESIKVKATAVGANLDQSSAGSLDIYYRFIPLP